MSKKQASAISPTRAEDFPEWYQQVIKASDLAERSAVRGCIVIKPWGYAIWENMVRILDGMFKQTGVKNAYFPIFIPLSFLEREAAHVEGFAKECAVVTHHRLEQGPEGGLVPAAPLTEPLIVRPTSETIIGDSFANWIKSHRDLPVLLNQWANVVRWEMRPRIFLRTSEFLWQEGHTVHATDKEAIERTHMMLDVYARFSEEILAVPVIQGKKSPAETFPGAIDTLCIEAMMQDRKAIQAGTSHFLGQNFSKAFQIKFQDKDENEAYGWTTSWGFSTRMIGAVIMCHGDDDGISLPPRIASSHVVLLPILRKPDDRERIMTYTETLARELKEKEYFDRKISVEIDDRNIGGARGWDWIKKGIPIRVEIGPKEVEKNIVYFGRRDKEPRYRESMEKNRFIQELPVILDDIQTTLYQNALAYREKYTVNIDQRDEFYAYFTSKNPEQPEIHGGFAISPWCGSGACEEKIKEYLGVTIRCIPLDAQQTETPCVGCGQRPARNVYFAKAY